MDKKDKSKFFWYASNEEKLKQSPCELIKQVQVTPIE